MANREVTLVSLARLWAAGRITLEQAVALSDRLEQPSVIAEFGHEIPYGGRAHSGSPANSFSGVMGLVGSELTVEQAHEFVSAVAAHRG